MFLCTFVGMCVRMYICPTFECMYPMFTDLYMNICIYVRKYVYFFLYMVYILSKYNGINTSLKSYISFVQLFPYS